MLAAWLELLTHVDMATFICFFLLLSPFSLQNVNVGAGVCGDVGR